MKLKYEQLKNLSQFKIAHKLYYKKYPFCVRLFSSVGIHRWDFASEDWFRDYRRTSEVRRWLKLHADFDYRTRHDMHLAIYLPDIDALSLVYNRYKNEIETVEGPINEQQTDTMLNDLSITVRDKLFYNKYRYKVSSYLYRSDMDQWTDLLEVCESSFEKENYKLNPTLKNYIHNKMIDQEMRNKQPRSLFRGRRWLPYAGTATVFLTDYDDVCTLHLMFKNIISDTTKIILKSELE